MIPPVEHDRGWYGVKMQYHPALVPPGYASEAVNMRFNHGVPETRPGVAWPAWANKITASGVQPWGTIHGLGEYKDPISLRTYQIIAADGAVYYTAPFNKPVQMTLPVGETITGKVTFTQAYDELVMWRGFDADPLKVDGIHRAWTTIPEPDEATGLRAIPRAERALYFQNRLWIPTRDEVVVSDFNDITGYLPARQELSIAPGSADTIVTLVKSGRNTIVVFKGQSVHALYNVHTSLNSLYLDTLTSQVGLAAPEAVADVGNEIWFLASDHTVRALVEMGGPNTEGVTRLKFKTRTNEQGEEVEVVASEDIAPLMERVNSQYVSGAQMAVWNRRVYLAMPVDAAELLGPELVPQPEGATLAELYVPVLVGKRYRFIPPGTLVGYGSNWQDFTAATDTAHIHTTTGNPSLRRVTYGVNRVMAVYDQRNGAWSGWDEAEGIDWGRLLKIHVNGKEQLLVITQEGWAGLLEQGYHDQLAQPYVEIRPTGVQSETGSLRVNSGDIITVDIHAALSTVVPPVWGTMTNPLTQLQAGFGL